MPTFSYRGYDVQGRKVGGSLRVSTRAKMEETVTRMGVTDFTVYDSDTRYSDRPYAFISPDELALFCREAPALLTSDISPAEGLGLLSGQTHHDPLKTTFKEIAGHMAGGMTLAGALSMYDHIFGAFLPFMAAVGEASGKLHQVFADLAVYYTEEARARSGLRSAIFYPAVRMILLWCVVFFLISCSLPVYGNLMAELNRSGDHAFLTGLFALMRFAYARGWVVALVVAVLAVLIFAAHRYPNGRPKADLWVVTLPFLRNIAMPYYTARLARGRVILLKYGVTMQDTEPCLRALIENNALEQKLRTIIARLNAGQELPTVMEDQKHILPVFPPAFHNMVLIGHQTDKMKDIMERAAEVFTTETERAVSRTALFMEPVMLLLFALTAGLPLLCVLLPLIEVVRSLGV